jgi:cysteine desulfurase
MSLIYFDNAASTAIDKEVYETMQPYFTTKFGNPSAIYSLGRETRAEIEKSRKLIAQLLGAHPGEIFFTSGGTESTNMVLRKCIHSLGVKHIITSPIEHHCVLHTVEDMAALGLISMHLLPVDAQGNINLQDLENLIKTLPSGEVLVTLMHANNEIGTMTDIHSIGTIVHQYNNYFHSDTVQTVGHFQFNLHEMPVDFITGSAHKLHGPKGVGLVYISDATKIKSMLTGGGQERNMRAGTENVSGIIGLAKAISMAYANFETEKNYIIDIKNYFKTELSNHFKGISFNGNQDKNLYTVLSVAFPRNEKTEMLLYRLDMEGICVSGGSACSSGANAGSHVINAINDNKADQATIRFSFSKYNTKEEVDITIQKLKTLLN